MDHFEGRSWGGLHRHITLCFMAYAFLTLLRGKGGEPFLGQSCLQHRRSLAVSCSRPPLESLRFVKVGDNMIRLVSFLRVPEDWIQDPSHTALL